MKEFILFFTIIIILYIIHLESHLSGEVYLNGIFL